jgi:mRNA-degrading endonuclease RelE of RelBE toxin-antitoxin system
LLRIAYDREVVQHLKAIDHRYNALIREAVEAQLAYEPDKPARNRKLLLRETALGATWELRVGDHNQFRGFYDVDDENRIVYILAVGAKLRERLYIGGEEFPL